MDHKNLTDIYDDGNIPEADLPQHGSKSSDKFTALSEFVKFTSTDNSDGIVEPLPESSRPRKDGPGGN